MLSLIDKRSYVVLVVAFVQFVNALEFMIIAPMGPYLAKAFNLELNQIGLLVGFYTLFSVLSGIIGHRFLDRLNKKNTLLVTLSALCLTTFLCTTCSDLSMILIFRAIAGFFGGLTLTLGMSVLINHIPETGRGRAFAVVMSAFPLVSIIGIPSALWLSHTLGWKAPFYLTALLISIGLITAFYFIPSMKHDSKKLISRPISLNKKTILAASLLGVAQFPIYLILPSLAMLLQYNMGVALKDLPLIFMTGGIASLIGTQISGHLSDLLGNLPVILISTVVLTMVFIFGLILSMLPPVLFISFLLLAVYMRLVSTTSLASRFPEPQQRSGFSAMQMAINNIFATAASFISTIILTQQNKMALENVFWLALLSTITSLTLPLLAYIYTNYLNQRVRVNPELAIS